MDETRLNIEAPLLSVRRCSTSPSLTEPKRKTLDKRHTLPYPKSDLTISINQLTEPVTVPFNWEQIPGRSKEPLITPTPPTLHEGTKRGSNSNGNDDDDYVYSDALDTMSPSQSFFMNCSVSGISGLELDNINATKSGAFYADSKSRDFMMDRFLPAAKAMTLQPPDQYASRKQQSVAVEQPREVINRSIREEKKLLLKKHISDILQKSSQSESEDDGDDHHDSADVSAKGCGLFPQLRIKNSLCLLNPMPVMKIRNQFPMSSSLEVVKPNKGSHVRSYSPAPAVKKAIDAIYKNKSSSESVSPDIREARKKWISQSCRFSSSAEKQQQGRLSPFRLSRAAAAVSPCRSRPQYPFRGARLLADSREAESNQSNRLNFQNKGHGNNIQENNSAVEKTLYIDTASTVKLSSSHSCSIDTVVEDSDKRRGKENNSTVESSEDVKHMGALEERNMLDSDMNKKQIVIVDDGNSGSGGVGSGLCPLPPPLPKSPSESWLWRALPLVSVKNPLMHSNLGAYSQSKNQDGFRISGNNTKWETIVKTSNLHDDHVRYSQELITSHISQHLKS